MAAITNPHLGAEWLGAGTAGAGELQRSNNFLVEIGGLGDEISFLIKGFPLPSESNELLTIRYGNSLIKLPGPINFSEGSLTIYDSIDLDTEKAIVAWRDKVFTKGTNALHRAANYKKDATITQFAPDGTSPRQWKLHGVWPQAYNPGEMDNDSTGVKTMSLTLQWDWSERIV